MSVRDKFSDAEIIHRVIEGEVALYEILIRRYNPALYKTGRSYNLNHEDTEDLMQETFVDAYRNLSSYQGRSEFKTWLIRIMLNHCYRKRNKSAFKNEIMKDPQELPEFPHSHKGSDTGKIVQNRELGRVLEEVLTSLPEDYRLVFSMRELNGLSVAETALALNISESNVKVRMNRAKAMLRKKMEIFYSPGEIYEFNLVYCDAMVEKVMHRIKEQGDVCD